MLAQVSPLSPESKIKLTKSDGTVRFDGTAAEFEFEFWAHPTHQSVLKLAQDNDMVLRLEENDGAAPSVTTYRPEKPEDRLKLSDTEKHQLAVSELENLSEYLAKRIKRLKRKKKAASLLEDKVAIENRITAAKRVLRALRLNQFTLEDSL